MTDKAAILAQLLEAYGVGVRAGVLTPCLQDENEFRGLLGLSPAPKEVEALWTAQGGTRAPVTLQRQTDTEDNTATPAQLINPEDI